MNRGGGAPEISGWWCEGKMVVRGENQRSGDPDARPWTFDPAMQPGVGECGNVSRGRLIPHEFGSSWRPGGQIHPLKGLIWDG